MRFFQVGSRSMYNALMKTGLKKLRGLRPADLLILLQTFFLLASMRLALALVSFEKICKWIGLKNAGETAVKPPSQDEFLRKVGWAVNIAADRTPWESACLSRALVAAFLLRQKGIPASLYLGVAKNAAGAGFSAHAWLRHGEQFITGEGGHERFSVIAVFSTQ